MVICHGTFKFVYILGKLGICHRIKKVVFVCNPIKLSRKSKWRFFLQKNGTCIMHIKSIKIKQNRQHEM